MQSSNNIDQQNSDEILTFETDNIHKELKEGNKKKNKNVLLIVCIELALLIAILLIVFGINKPKSLFNQSIIITEIVCSNDSSLITSNQETPDWIELFNNSANDVNLSGYSIISDSKKGESYTFGEVIIPAGEYFVVYASDNSFETSNAPCLGFNLSKNDETISLLDNVGHELQSISIPELYTDISYSLDDHNIWGYCINPTPGKKNSSTIQTLDSLLSSTDKAKIEISEVFPNSSDDNDWVELHNSGDTAISLALYYISDNSTGKNRYHLPDVCIASGDHYLINLPNEAISFGFSDKDSGVYLFNLKDDCLDSITWDSKIGKDIAVVSDKLYSTDPTPGLDNSQNVFKMKKIADMDETDPVRINEVLIKNSYSITDAEGDHSSWVEIYNNSNKSVSLNGYFLSDDYNSLLKWAFPNTRIQPFEYIIIFLSGKADIDTQLHSSFRIGSNEVSLYMTDINTMRTDSFSLPDERLDNVSFGRSSDGDILFHPYPTPYAENTVGFESLDSALQKRSDGIYISEVCATGDDYDWVELYNGSDIKVDLSGYYISDSKDNLKKHPIPSITINPHEYSVIDSIPELNIDASGETLIITGVNGEYIDAFETGMLRKGITSGRKESSSSLQRVFFSTPTKSSVNSKNIITGYTNAPTFSQTKLYHTERFDLIINCPSKDAQIYYTLDGSVPDSTDTPYNKPIIIDKNSVIRAVAYNVGMFPSEVITSTYLFEAPHTVPVVCLSGESNEMKHVFHYSSRRYKPEMPASVEYYEQDGTLGIFFNAGLKPKGRSSLDYDQKSVTIKIRGKYGRDEVIYPFFEDQGTISFSSITLRNGGQDISGSRLRDSLFQTLAKDMNLDSIRTRLAVVYVNGEYWGLYNLNEEQEVGYFESYYDLDGDSMDLINRNNTVVKGSVDAFLQVRDYGQNWNLSNDDVFADYTKLVDTDSCMDYIIVNTYFGNGDVLNQKFWRAQDSSVLWRPILFDLDWCMRFNQKYRNTFNRYFNKEGSYAGNGTLTLMDIFYGLKQNASWRDSFVKRFVNVAYNDFDTNRVLNVFDDMVSQMEPEMERHIARWGTHKDIDSWKEQTSSFRIALEMRREIVLPQMARYFSVSDEYLNKLINEVSSN